MDEFSELPLADPEQFEIVFKARIRWVREGILARTGQVEAAQKGSMDVFLKLWEARNELEKEGVEAFLEAEMSRRWAGSPSGGKGGKVPDFDLEEAWEAFTEMALSEAPVSEPARSGRKRNTKMKFLVGGALAIVGVVLVLWWSLPPKPLKVAAAPGQRLDYTLPDGMPVKLNAASAISFSEKDFSSDGLLNLDGEAFFEVKEGHPLEVAFSGGKVVCPKGKFDLRVREEGWDAWCYEGELSLLDTKGTLLTQLFPGQMYKFRLEGLKTIFDPGLKTWREGELVYETAPYEEVVAELERQFGITIFFPARGFPVFTGSLTILNRDVTLDVFARTYGMKFTDEGNGKVNFSLPD
ncbi:MAG: FecR domain-containing protein [Bacteroidia bacterium]|nr:FecR domain-containing protein [Bacteroidia bacterium]